MDLVLGRYAKAIAPALLTLFAVVVHWAVSGELNRAELELAIVGLGSAIVTLFVPNGADVHDHQGDPPESDTTTLGTDVDELARDTGATSTP